jgi:RNA polymerase sigma-70 factor (ECF subfamily)
MKLFSHNDKKLVEKCLLNDRVAQKELFEKYHVAMFNIALRITGNEDMAYDAVQEAFINAFNNLRQFQFKSTLGAWIKKILVREAVRCIKDEKMLFNSLDEVYDEPVIWPNDISGEHLHKTILELPDGFRTIFTLIEIEGYSHKEVAEILNISEGTSKSQLYRAKKNLQMKLSEFVNG